MNLYLELIFDLEHKMKNNILYLLIILLAMFSGCSNHYEPEALISNDNNDINASIMKNGYYEDSAGNKFNEVLKSEHFYFYYNSNDTNGKIYLLSMKEYLESNYKKVIDFFGIDEKDMPVVQIFMYAKYKDFNYAVLKDKGINLHNCGDPNASTISENKIYMTHSTIKNNVKYFYKGAFHEYVHCCTMVYGANPEMWLREGIALYLTEGSDLYKDKHTEFIENGLPPKYVLNNEGRYTYTYSIVEYIAKTYGNEKLLELIMQGGEYEKVLGITTEELENGWINFLKDKLI